MQPIDVALGSGGKLYKIFYEGQFREVSRVLATWKDQTDSPKALNTRTFYLIELEDGDKLELLHEAVSESWVIHRTLT